MATNYELPRVIDSISYLYFEKCHIEQDAFAVKAVYETIPSGKQTTYASNVRPSYMLFEHFNNKKAISYFNAIDKPVRVKQDMGLIEESINRLTEEVNTWDIGEGFKGTRVDFHANNLSYNPIQNASSYVNIHDAINAVMNSI